MCEKKIIVLKQQLIKPARPVQTVTPEPAKPLQASPQIIKPGRVLKKANTMPKVYDNKFYLFLLSISYYEPEILYSK